MTKYGGVCWPIYLAGYQREWGVPTAMQQRGHGEESLEMIDSLIAS